MNGLQSKEAEFRTCACLRSSCVIFSTLDLFSWLSVLLMTCAHQQPGNTHRLQHLALNDCACVCYADTDTHDCFQIHLASVRVERRDHFASSVLIETHCLCSVQATLNKEEEFNMSLSL